MTCTVLDRPYRARWSRLAEDFGWSSDPVEIRPDVDVDVILRDPAVHWAFLSFFSPNTIALL